MIKAKSEAAKPLGPVAKPWEAPVVPPPFGGADTFDAMDAKVTPAFDAKVVEIDASIAKINDQLEVIECYLGIIDGKTVVKTEAS